MCDPVSAAVGIGGALLASQMSRPPSMPDVKAPTTPQSSKAPTAQSVAAGVSGSGQGGGAPGAAQTMLTGSSGISMDDLLLGKKTLLGQ